MTIYTSINPATEEIISEHQETTSDQLDNILELSKDAQISWSETSINERLKLVKNLKITIEENKELLAKTITLEMGKVFKESLAEVNRLELFCTHALERLEDLLSYKKIPNPLSSAYIRHDPLGTILAITPWNAPLSTPFRIALPAILTGNSIILKPAPNVAGIGKLIEDIFLKAGFPKNLFKLVLTSNQLTEKLITNNIIKKIAFVGSTQVGSRLAGIAGENIKPILLELGGSDPFIVLKDADVQKAALDAAAARCTNAGQVCCASKRMIIEDSIYEKFVNLFISQMKSKTVGDPFNEQTSYGPLARHDILEKLTSQVNKAKLSGSKVLLEGGQVPGRGYYFSPMILEESSDNGFSTNEEFFGPVASIFRARDLEHAIKIANLSHYGLGAAVYTGSNKLADYVSTKLENGFVYINRPPSLHPYLPFGGVKRSGFGKDCGDEGYYEYVNKKIIID